MLRRYSSKNTHSSKVTLEKRVPSVANTLRKSAIKGPRAQAGCFVRVCGTTTAAASGGCEVALGREDGLFSCEGYKKLVVE